MWWWFHSSAPWGPLVLSAVPVFRFVASLSMSHVACLREANLQAERQSCVEACLQRNEFYVAKRPHCHVHFRDRALHVTLATTINIGGLHGISQRHELERWIWVRPMKTCDFHNGFLYTCTLDVDSHRGSHVVGSAKNFRKMGHVDTLATQRHPAVSLLDLV